MTDQAAEQKLAFVKEARQLLALFNDPVWAISGAEDSHHVSDLCDQLMFTRGNHPDLPAETAMSMVMDDGDRVLAVTGNTPDAALRAKAIVGLIHSMPALLDLLEASITFDARVAELLEHNNAQLFENRAQRQEIRQLQAQVDWLTNKIPGVQAS